MKMRPPTATAVAGLLLALAGRPAAAQPTTVTVLDSAGIVGAGSDVAYGPNGRALVSYLDATNGALKVAACQDIACTAAVLHAVDTSGAVTGSTSIAFGPDGLARIAYQAGTAVRLARCADAGCSAAALATVDTRSRALARHRGRRRRRRAADRGVCRLDRRNSGRALYRRCLRRGVDHEL